jgi:hypothetical protein
MSAGSSCLAYARSNQARFVAELGEFVRFASVSAQPEHAHDVRNCASWLAAHLRQVGFERAQVVWTRGCLIVYVTGYGSPDVRRFSSTDIMTCNRSVRSENGSRRHSNSSCGVTNCSVAGQNSTCPIFAMALPPRPTLSLGLRESAWALCKATGTRRFRWAL